MPTFFVVVQYGQMFFLFCLREEKVIFAIRTRTDADAARKSFISCKKKKLINNILSKPKVFITYLVRWEYLKRRKGCKEKKCKIKECKWVAKIYMKCGIIECESTNCFWKCGTTDCDPLIFVRCENKIYEVLSKNWKNLNLTMLILACTNYIS